MHLPTKSLLALVLTVVPGLKTIAKAQDLIGLPSCAKPALLAAFQASGCAPNDVNCLCSNPNLESHLFKYVQTACDPADQAAVIAFGQKYCGIDPGVSATIRPDGSSATSTNSDIPLSGFTVASTNGPLVTATSLPSSATAKPTNGTQTGGAVIETGLSAAALAIAIGAMGWVFAEL